MSNFADALLALDDLDGAGTLVAMAAGLLICVAGPLFHELGHFVPARVFSGGGRSVLFPFAQDGGVRAWFSVFAFDVPNEKLRTLSAFQTGVVIIAGPVADLLFTLLCAATWPMVPEPIGVGIAAGGAALAFVWLLNVIPISALGNDGARFAEFVMEASSMIYIILCAAMLGAITFFDVWRRERTAAREAIERASRLAAENEQRRATVVTLFSVLEGDAGGIEARIKEHALLAAAIQKNAPQLVRIEPEVPGWLNRHDHFCKALRAVAALER